MTFVYLVEAQCGLVKIGCAARPADRLATIQLHSPVPSRLLAQWPGKIADEHALHARFSAHRSHNEWFRIDGDLLTFVAEVRGRGIGAVQPWETVSFGGGADRRRAGLARRSASQRRNWSDPAWHLDQLVRMRSGRIEARELSYAERHDRSDEGAAKRHAIAERARDLVHASQAGQRLLDAIAGKPAGAA